jgi:LacI family transcriptional regulator
MDSPRVVLLLNPLAGYDRGLLEGIARYAQLHGPWIFLLPEEHPTIPRPDSDSVTGEFQKLSPLPSTTKRRPSLQLQALNASGIIGRIQTPEIARSLLASNLPIVTVELAEKQLLKNNPLSRLSEVCADSHKAGRMAAEHLLERGFTNFGFCGYQERIWSQRRQEGFCERIQESGFHCQIYRPPQRKRILTWRDEQSAVIAWLQSLPKPIGIMACNDIRGRQLIEACHQADLQVPDDVAVVGVDEDRLLCDLANPPLSSVALNLDRAGYRAAELLDELMSGRIRKPEKILVEPLWVVQRRSTNVVAVEDRHVAAAVQFVRDHFRQAITVSDIVRHAGISRRSLEIRFQNTFGRSIRHEIQRVRLEWSKKLLAETNLSTEKIAEVSGFRSPNYMCSVFHRELRVSPTQYRRNACNP